VAQPFQPCEKDLLHLIWFSLRGAEAMPSTRHTVVGLGELLWDLLPAGKQLGGAPANFAYITSLLGDAGIPASRLGQDELGEEAIRRLGQLGLPTDSIQRDTQHPTGTVKVEVDRTGQPRFEICESVAWDFLSWTSQWQKLANQADAVCFGSLAQRSATSRSTIRCFLQATRPDAVRVFDVNLRQSFYSAEVLSVSMKLATIVKLNHEELPRIMELFELEHRTEELSAQRLVELYDLKLVCITRGNGGSLLTTRDASHAHQGFRVKVADTVGAGDAFTAAMVHEYLRGASLQHMNEAANRIGAWVASQVGATPGIKPGGLERTLAEVS
jgi:fructokinase